MDTAVKTDHRFLTDFEMFSIVESSEGDLKAAMPKLDELGAQIFDGGLYEPGLYARLVKEKVYQSAIVKDEAGRSKFILIYTVSRFGLLFIEATASIERSSLKSIFNAVDALARHFNVKGTQCVTKLSGMFRFSKSAGYAAAGIIIYKPNPLYEPNALPA